MAGKLNTNKESLGFHLKRNKINKAWAWLLLKSNSVFTELQDHHG